MLFALGPYVLLSVKPIGSRWARFNVNYERVLTVEVADKDLHLSEDTWQYIQHREFPAGDYVFDPMLQEINYICVYKSRLIRLVNSPNGNVVRYIFLSDQWTLEDNAPSEDQVLLQAIHVPAKHFPELADPEIQELNSYWQPMLWEKKIDWVNLKYQKIDRVYRPLALTLNSSLTSHQRLCVLTAFESDVSGLGQWRKLKLCVKSQEEYSAALESLVTGSFENLRKFYQVEKRTHFKHGYSKKMMAEYDDHIELVHLFLKKLFQWLFPTWICRIINKKFYAELGSDQAQAVTIADVQVFIRSLFMSELNTYADTTHLILPLFPASSAVKVGGASKEAVTLTHIYSQLTAKNTEQASLKWDALSHALLHVTPIAMPVKAMTGLLAVVNEFKMKNHSYFATEDMSDEVVMDFTRHIVDVIEQIGIALRVKPFFVTEPSKWDVHAIREGVTEAIELNTCILGLEGEKTIPLINALQPTLTKIIPSGDEFHISLRHLKDEQAEALIEALKLQLPQLLKKSSGLRAVMSFLHVASIRRNVFHALETIMNADLSQFSAALQGLNPTQVTMIFNMMSGSLSGAIRNSVYLNLVLRVLHAEQAKEVVNKLMDRFNVSHEELLSLRRRYNKFITTSWLRGEVKGDRIGSLPVSFVELKNDIIAVLSNYVDPRGGFFALHWNRHHKNLVRKMLKSIDGANDVTELKEILLRGYFHARDQREIENDLKNFNAGSLNRRIRFASALITVYTSQDKNQDNNFDNVIALEIPQVIEERPATSKLAFMRTRRI